ncbi:MAG: sigma-54 dependent transcriptional regulator [Pseudomonadota bacterium]
MTDDLKILLVDDDPVHARLVEGQLKAINIKPKIAKSGKEALKILLGGKIQYDVVLLDWVMPQKSGLDVLREARADCPDTSFIILTANSSINNVVEAMQNGACDFLIKPASPERLQIAMENALKVSKLQHEVARLKQQVKHSKASFELDNMVAESPVMRKILKLAGRAAQSNIPVLIDGESGTGKELMARAIRANSVRKDAPFVTVNCGAIPANLVESTLFGHEKGSFTGATDKHLGKFQEADGGTIFLDEIGELPLDMQVKLLRVLQEGEVDPIGAKRPVKVNVRVLSATNRDLFDMIKTGDFREDLFYRLNVFQLTLPPLRDRKEDLKHLAYNFLEKISIEEEKEIKGITPAAEKIIMNYEWPGNIRQLENIIFRAVVLADHDLLQVEDFPCHIIGYKKKKSA